MRKNEDAYRDDEYHCETHMISACCGAAPLGSVDEDAFGHSHGICSECKQQSNFEKDTEDESLS